MLDFSDFPFSLFFFRPVLLLSVPPYSKIDLLVVKFGLFPHHFVRLQDSSLEVPAGSIFGVHRSLNPRDRCILGSYEFIASSIPFQIFSAAGPLLFTPVIRAWGLTSLWKEFFDQCFNPLFSRSLSSGFPCFSHR